MSITVKNITKRFGNFVALDNVSLEIPNGKLTALLGPSGSGKTTLLRIIAGLDSADEGTILHHGEDVTGLPPKERNVGFVFQHYALFRHMTVFQNIAFGMEVRKIKKDVIKGYVMELLHLVRLKGMEHRYPTQLSGGQRQRVALARALAVQPKFLLLDEPFGALDAKVRQELRQWLRRLHDELHQTSIFVTHDQEEAFEVADQVVVMRAGKIEQAGSPHDVFEHPANPFVMDFLGQVNVFHGRVQDGHAVVGNSLQFAMPQFQNADSRDAKVYVRPHELDIDVEPFAQKNLKARIIHVNPMGSMARVQLQADEFDLPIHVDVNHERFKVMKLATGMNVYVAPKNMRVFLPDYTI
jgi:sulfate transport system ATP-binding protein